jgi:hypothetical protein
LIDLGGRFEFDLNPFIDIRYKVVGSIANRTDATAHIEACECQQLRVDCVETRL